jgi:hypothetical protein
MLQRYLQLQERISTLPVEAVAERVLLSQQLAQVKAKLSRMDLWKLSKGIRE